MLTHKSETLKIGSLENIKTKGQLTLSKPFDISVPQILHLQNEEVAKPDGLSLTFNSDIILFYMQEKNHPLFLNQQIY